MLKNNQITRIFGPAVLFCALFLPGYLYQSAEAAATTLNDPALIAQTMALEIPQIALILFVILTRAHGTRKTAGIVPLRARDFLIAAAGTVGLFLTTIPGAFAASGSGDAFFSNLTGEPVQPGVLLLLAPFCLIAAYREELFFRSYIINELEPYGHTAGIAIGAVLFSLGHVYQGIGAAAVTGLIGVFLGWLFLKTRNVHLITLSHGLYNYLVLLLTRL